MNKLDFNISFWIPIVISIGTLIWNFFQQKVIEKIKRENQKILTIHKSQFEKEFQVFTEIWEAIIVFKLANTKFVSKYKFNISETTFVISDEFKNEISKLGKHFDEVTSLLYKRKPFIPIEVYLKLKDLFVQLQEDFTMLNLLNKDISQQAESALKGNEFDPDPLLKFINAQLKILAQTEQKIEEVSNAIRNRLFDTRL